MQPGEDKGIYPKYVVFKHPGFEPEVLDAKAFADSAGEYSWSTFADLEHVDDWVFVLKPISDPHARIALAAYAESCKAERPQLSQDIYEVLGDY